MKTITILSGKGGVGKSSITASMAVMLSRMISKNKKIVCADCDVDAANLSLVFGTEKMESWEDLSTNEEAYFDLDRCNSCGKCFKNCYFNAIGWNTLGPQNNKPYLKKFSCEGCGFCELICPQNAIRMKKVNNAKIGHAKTNYGFDVVSAQLNAGSSGSGKVVFEVKKKAEEIGKGAELMIVDSAAGIGCPVISSVTGSDYAIIVTEPTPSGFHDMKKAVEVVDHFKIPYSIIVNKYDINQDTLAQIEKFSESRNREIILKVPFDRKFAEALKLKKPIVELDNKYADMFGNLAKRVRDLMGY